MDSSNMNTDFTQLGIGVMAVMLLGYIAKLTFPYFLRKIDEKDAVITKLTEDFRETINHKQTEFSAAINRQSEAVETLAENIAQNTRVTESQTDVFKQLIKQK